jgi:hypothetical protein
MQVTSSGLRYPVPRQSGNTATGRRAASSFKVDHDDRPRNIVLSSKVRGITSLHIILTAV